MNQVEPKCAWAKTTQATAVMINACRGMSSRRKISHAQEHRSEERDRVERFADDELTVLDRKHALPF
jgi:hypothetical protein